MKGWPGTTEGRSGKAAFSAGICDDLTSGGGPSLSLQAERAVLLHVSATSLPPPKSPFTINGMKLVPYMEFLEFSGLLGICQLY